MTFRYNINNCFELVTLTSQLNDCVSLMKSLERVKKTNTFHFSDLIDIDITSLIAIQQYIKTATDQSIVVCKDRTHGYILYIIIISKIDERTVSFDFCATGWREIKQHVPVEHIPTKHEFIHCVIYLLYKLYNINKLRYSISVKNKTSMREFKNGVSEMRKVNNCSDILKHVNILYKQTAVNKTPEYFTSVLTYQVHE